MVFISRVNGWNIQYSLRQILISSFVFVQIFKIVGAFAATGDKLNLNVDNMLVNDNYVELKFFKYQIHFHVSPYKGFFSTLEEDIDCMVCYVNQRYSEIYQNVVHPHQIVFIFLSIVVSLLNNINYSWLLH